MGMLAKHSKNIFLLAGNDVWGNVIRY